MTDEEFQTLVVRDAFGTATDEERAWLTSDEMIERTWSELLVLVQKVEGQLSLEESAGGEPDSAWRKRAKTVLLRCQMRRQQLRPLVKRYRRGVHQ